jgi:hypothetical protein
LPTRTSCRDAARGNQFEDGLIAELWGIGQPVPEESPNENGMF